jgi:flagellar hook-associated protein 2
MIASDPDKVMEFFTGFANNLYNDLYSKMGSSSLSSIYKVYNDKELATEQKDWEKKVSDLEQKLKDIEDKYYKKFASMEKLLSSINSKQSAVGSYFGQ